MRELIVRLASSAIGYIGLVLLLRSPEPVRTFALYLPSSILVTLAFDAGRSELALRHGLAHDARRRLRLESAALGVLGLAATAELLGGALTPRAQALAALGIAGALQAHVDIHQRDCLFRYRRSLHALLFQAALASANAAVAGAIAIALVRPAVGLAALAALPSLASLVYVQVVTRRCARVAEPEPESGSGSLGIAALGFRAFPPAAYTAYAFVLATFARELAAVARALYFVFGFVHMRVMAREAGPRTVLRTTVELSAAAAAAALPLLAFSSPIARVPWTAIAACIAATIAATAALSLFLVRYRVFLHDRRAVVPLPASAQSTP